MMEFQNKIGDTSDLPPASDIDDRKAYRPRSTRTWILLLYTVVVLFCIVLLQLLVSLGSDFTPGPKLILRSPGSAAVVHADDTRERSPIGQPSFSHQIRQENSLPPEVPATTTTTTTTTTSSTTTASSKSTGLGTESTVGHGSYLATTGASKSSSPTSNTDNDTPPRTTSSVPHESFLASSVTSSAPGHEEPSSFPNTQTTTPRLTTTPSPSPDTTRSSSVPLSITSLSASKSRFLNSDGIAPPSSSVSPSNFLDSSKTRPASTLAPSNFLDTSHSVPSSVPTSSYTTSSRSSSGKTSQYSVSHDSFLDPQQTAGPSSNVPNPSSDVLNPSNGGQITNPRQDLTGVPAPTDIKSGVSPSTETSSYIGEDGKPTTLYLPVTPSGADANTGSSPTGGQHNPNSPADSENPEQHSDSAPGTTPSPNQPNNLPASTPMPSFRPLPDRFVLLREPGPMGARQYFAIVFLPKVLAVAMQAVWSVSHAAVKLMEPFYQLGSSAGANAQSSLLADYASNELSWQSLIDMFRGQWALFFSNIITIMLFVVVTLIAEVLRIVPTNFCKTDISNAQPCEPALYADTVLLHTIQALLGLVAVSLIAIMILNVKRRSRVFSDPSKLASLATLLGHQPLMQNLLASDPAANDHQVSAEFRNIRYSLGYFSHDSSGQNYGIVESDVWDPYSERNPNMHHGPDTNNTMLSQLYEMYQKTWLESFVLSLVIALFGVVLAYYFVGSGSFNEFMSNQTFGPKFVLACAAVVIVMGLRSIERRERILQLYRAMARSPQRAEDSVLLSLGGTPYIGLFNGFAHKWRFVSLVSFITILADLMQIAVSGIPFEGGQTLESYKICTYLSLCILGLMIIVIVLVIWRTKRFPNSPPRSPARLVNALLYLCGGNLLHQQSGTSDNKALYQRYRGRYFSFRYVEGADGKFRWTVFEVEHPHPHSHSHQHEHEHEPK